MKLKCQGSAQLSLLSLSNTFRKPLTRGFTEQAQEVMHQNLNQKLKLDERTASNISGVGNKNTRLTISSAVAEAGPVNGSVPHTFNCSENFSEAQLMANGEFGVVAAVLEFPLWRLEKKSTDINPSGC